MGSTRVITMSKQVAIVDDNEGNRKLLLFALRAGDYELHQADTFAAAKELLGRDQLDLALFDVELPDGSGMELAKTCRERFPQSTIIMLSALDTNALYEKALKSGANAYVIKPYNLRNVLALIKQLEEQPVKPFEDMLMLPNNAPLSHYRPAARGGKA